MKMEDWENKYIKKIKQFPRLKINKLMRDKIRELYHLITIYENDEE